MIREKTPICDLVDELTVERVEKLDSPILVIGLGGTGSSAVCAIKRAFAERFALPTDANGQRSTAPKHTAYLAIDYDSYYPAELENDEFLCIGVPGLTAMLGQHGHAYTQPWTEEWLDKHLDGFATAAGCGNYRQTARLMLSSHYDDVVRCITNKLLSICATQHGLSPLYGRVNIVVVSGISGGTGSGTFLDVAQIIHHMMASNGMFRGLRYQLMGYLVLPDASCDVFPPSHPLLGVSKRNAYAALKELDHWMGYGNQHKENYTVQYTQATSSRIRWTKPFNTCVLLSGSTYNGRTYCEAKKVVYNTIAEQLLNYMTKEDAPTSMGVGGVPHSYISYENNLSAASLFVERPLPLNYAYRAIGVYTKQIPKRKIVAYEAGKLMKNFMPLRDHLDELVARTTLLDKFVCRQDALKFFERIEELYNSFAAVVKLPSFCSFNIYDRIQVDVLAHMSEPPHKLADTGTTPWLSAVVEPGAQEAAEEYRTLLWSRFEQLVKDVISDPQLGPFALYAYLDPKQSKSLYSAFTETITKWQTVRDNHQCLKAERFAACREAWHGVEDPPFIGRNRVLEQYSKALSDFYDTLRSTAFLEAFIAVAQTFISCVERYRQTALTKLCNELDELDRQLKQSNKRSLENTSELFDFSEVQPTLDKLFEQRNTDAAVTRAFLMALADESLTSERDPDPQSCGVQFPFANSGDCIVRLLRSSLDDCFADVNNASMDQLLEQRAGGDAAAKRAEMDRLAMELTNNFDPLFSADPAMCGIDRVAFTYLLVPRNSPELLSFLETQMPNAQVRAGDDCDRIIAFTTYEALPLCLYSWMTDIKQEYASEAQNGCITGLHLVYRGDVEADVTQNWSKLPSPSPYFLFSEQGHPFEMQRFESALSTLDRAVKCGVISIDDSSSEPSYTLRILYADGRGVQPKRSEQIISELKAIDDRKEPDTEEPLAESRKKVLFQQYSSEARERMLTSFSKPICMQYYLGLQGQPCDPFTPVSQVDPETLEQAMKNHRELCRVLAAVYLYNDPVTWLSIDSQLEGMEYLQECIARCGESHE